jgi:uncharacterized membrane protein
MAYIGNQPISAAFLVDTFSGNGSTVNYTMTVAPANTSSIIVAITGVVQDPSTYAVNGTTLTFSQAPPSGTSNISVRYLGIPASGVTTTAYRTVTDITATSGQTTFTIPSYTVGFVDVFRNGVRLAAADYTATTGTTIVLVNGATVGDTITTVSFLVSSVLNAIPATAGSVGTTLIADNAITTAKIAAGAVVQADLATGVAGNGPAFSAYMSNAQSVSSVTFTKVAFNTELFDTANAFDTTNYRFQPNVAGYYQINTVYNQAANQVNILRLYKNGSYLFELSRLYLASAPTIGGSTLVFMNGTTDYIELYFYCSAATTIGSNDGSLVWMNGNLARAA